MPVTEHAQNITPNTDTVTDKQEVPPDIFDSSFIHIFPTVLKLRSDYE